MKKMILSILIMFSVFSFSAVNYDDFLGYWTNGFDWIYSITKDEKQNYYIQNVTLDDSKLTKWELAHTGQISVVSSGKPVWILPKKELKKTKLGLNFDGDDYAIVVATEEDFDIQKGDKVLEISSEYGTSIYRRLTKEENQIFSKTKKRVLTEKDMKKYFGN